MATNNEKSHFARLLTSVRPARSLLLEKAQRLPIPVVVFVAVLPLIIASTYLANVQGSRHEIETITQKEMAAHMAADLITEKLDRVADVGVALSTRTTFQKDIEAGKWEDALRFMQGVTKDFSYIDLVTLFDTEGTLRATTSGDADVVGESFVHRDYYQGVSKNWEPYVSDVFKKASKPAYNIVLVAIPIYGDSKKVLGILGLSIRLDTFTNWIRPVDADHSEDVYIADRKGYLVAHSHLVLGDILTDFSSVVAVQRGLKGETGSDISFDPVEQEERLAAYVPVPRHGWVAVSEQSASTAFAERDREVFETIFILSFVIITLGFFFTYILRNRARIKTQRDRENMLLKSIGDGIVVIDKDRNITLWNKSASIITGWSEDEVLGKPLLTIMRLIKEQDRTEYTAFIDDAMMLCKVVSIEKGILLVRKDGSEISVGDSAAPLCDPAGVVGGAIIVFRDISEEQKAARLRSDFTYASHQLRTPVTEALWNLETAMTTETAEKKQEFMWIAHHSLESVKDLTEHLVTISGIDQGEVSARISTVKLVDIFDKVKHDLEFKMQKHKITLAIESIPATLVVNTDPKLLGRALSEVMENAVIYSKENTEVKVVATLQDKNLLVEVTDTGTGIPEEEQVIIFTKFFRASNRPVDSIGAGLGLFIAKEYTKLLGGKIWFTSEEGKGTTFYILVPIG